MAPKDAAVFTTLNFYLEPSKGGHSSYSVGTAGYYRRRFDTRSVEIRDIRRIGETVDLNTHGFQLQTHVSGQKTFADDARMKDVVYTEVKQLLKEVYESSISK